MGEIGLATLLEGVDNNEFKKNLLFYNFKRFSSCSQVAHLQKYLNMIEVLHEQPALGC